MPKLGLRLSDSRLHSGCSSQMKTICDEGGDRRGEAFFQEAGRQQCSRPRDGVGDHTKDGAGRKQTPLLHRRFLDPFQWSTTICRGLGAMKVESGPAEQVKLSHRQVHPEGS